MAIYIVAAILVIAGGSYKIMENNEMIAAVLFFIGSLTCFIIYGIRWFSKGSSIFSGAPVSWPPIINTCPDYLTYFKRGDKDTCIDLIGVARCGQNHKCLKLYPKAGTPDDDCFFDLTTKSADPVAKNAELCARAIEYGLTWEGITNGEGCIASNGQTYAPDGGANSRCPSSK